MEDYADGHVAWKRDYTRIGQQIDYFSHVVDYILLMLYPAGFHWRIPGYRNPVANTTG
jgi:hypothetical protein